jgi:hypothetical protein
VYLPSRLVIEAQWDEAERLGHMFAERQELDRVTLIFRQC